jgi:DNA-binding XRE family transcriptional regulator
MKTAARHRIITAEQIISARRLLSWTKLKLAKQSKISRHSVSNLEDPAALSKAKPKTLVAVRTAFEDAGIVFDHDGVRQKAG